MTSPRPDARRPEFDLLGAPTEVPKDGHGRPTTESQSPWVESWLAAMEKPALSQVPENLMEQIVAEDNMERAWKNVRANRGAPGPDGITLKTFPEYFRPLWPAIRQSLLEGTYQPDAARRKAIPKPDGGERHLGIPNVQDRLIQQAILQVLTPIFDPHFSESSFGFRPKRSAHGAVRQVQKIIQHRHRYCVDMDLSKFFDQSS